MTTSIEDLTTPLTTDEIKSAIYAVINRTGASTTNWKPGAVVRTLITAVAIVLSGLSQLAALLAKSAFLPLATGEWLRLVAFYVYNVTRLEATYATGQLTVRNSGGGVFTAAAGGFTVRNPTTGKTYVNIAPFTSSSVFNEVTIDIAALEPGAASTSYTGEITELVSQWTAVTCSNDAPVVGSDRETDQSLRQRCLDKLGALSPNGPADAYRFVARSAVRADGSPIGVNRVSATPDGKGSVNVYLAGVTGAITGVVTDITTDLGVIADLLWRLCVPLCVNLNLASATPRAIPITYTVWCYNTSGLSTQQIKDVISANLVSYFDSAPIGGYLLDGTAGYLYRSELIAVIGRAQQASGVPLPIVRVDLLSPNVDTLIGSNEVPALGVINGTINQITPVGV